MITYNPKTQLPDIIQALMDCKNSDADFEITIKKISKVRTDNQNRAIHLYCSMLSKALIDKGESVQTVMKVKTVAVMLSPDIVKELLFKPVMTAVFPDVESTAKLTTNQVSVVYEHLNRHTSELFGIGIDFPSRQG